RPTWTPSPTTGTSTARRSRSGGATTSTTAASSRRSGGWSTTSTSWLRSASTRGTSRATRSSGGSESSASARPGDGAGSRWRCYATRSATSAPAAPPASASASTARTPPVRCGSTSGPECTWPAGTTRTRRSSMEPELRAPTLDDLPALVEFFGGLARRYGSRLRSEAELRDGLRRAQENSGENYRIALEAKPITAYVGLWAPKDPGDRAFFGAHALPRDRRLYGVLVDWAERRAG